MKQEQTLTLPKSLHFLKNFSIILGISILFALSSWISIRLPFTPVPIVFTPQLILLSAVVFGRKGAYATCVYLLQGIIGFPVFSNGGSGILYLFGPTGGYLIGYVVAAFAVAFLKEKIKEKSSIKVLGIMLFGNALIFIFGLYHLSHLVGISKALTLGLYPFVGGDLIKIVIAHRAAKKFIG